MRHIGAVSPGFGDAVLSALLTTASTPILTKATDTELRQSLTAGGDLYNDRFGAFYLNGVRTQAMDVAVTSRLLVQDNVSGEYKTLMDELAERNNLIAAARSAVAQIDSATTKPIAEQRTALAASLANLSQLYGYADILSEKLTSGQISGLEFPKISDVTDYLKGIQSYINGGYLDSLQNVQSTLQGTINTVQTNINIYEEQIQQNTQELISVATLLNSLPISDPQLDSLRAEVNRIESLIQDQDNLQSLAEEYLVELRADLGKLCKSPEQMCLSAPEAVARI